ncbi:hypothetical protein [Alteromonas portus]|uniref:hypothetical protein n=1 Tax=Alteromonas portus TaxID=2565549 RepID=UPI003BF8F000
MLNQEKNNNCEDSSALSAQLENVKIKQGLANNRLLSDSFQQLAILQLSDKQLANVSLDLMAEDVPIFMQSYDHLISPWPVIIDKDMLAKFDYICATLPTLLYKVMTELAKSERQYLLDYLNISELQLDLFLQRNIEIRDVVCRYDAVISNGVIKLVEANIGTMIGGLHLSWITPQSLNLLKLNDVSKTWNLVDRNGYGNLFSSVVSYALREKRHNATGNCVFFLPVQAKENLELDSQLKYESLLNTLETVYKEKLPAHLKGKGKLFFCDSQHDLSLASGNKLCFKDEEVDGIVFHSDTENQVPREIYSLLEAGFVDGQYYYPDALAYTLMSIKLLFALVHEIKVKKILTPEERELVASCIPLSMRLSSEHCLLEGKITSIKTLIENNKDRFVIKKSRSMQGNDVMVGRSVDQDTWMAFYNQHKHDSDWLLQEMCIPDDNICADSTNGVGIYKMVWGIFSFGGQYSGSFIRAMPENGDSVINSARGANEFLVFEEQQYKNKITL